MHCYKPVISTERCGSNFFLYDSISELCAKALLQWSHIYGPMLNRERDPLYSVPRLPAGRVIGMRWCSAPCLWPCCRITASRWWLLLKVFQAATQSGSLWVVPFASLLSLSVVFYFSSLSVAVLLMYYSYVVPVSPSYFWYLYKKKKERKTRKSQRIVNVWSFLLLFLLFFLFVWNKYLRQCWLDTQTYRRVILQTEIMIVV